MTSEQRGLRDNRSSSARRLAVARTVKEAEMAARKFIQNLIQNATCKAHKEDVNCDGRSVGPRTTVTFTGWTLRCLFRFRSPSRRTITNVNNNDNDDEYN